MQHKKFGAGELPVQQQSLPFDHQTDTGDKETLNLTVQLSSMSPMSTTNIHWPPPSLAQPRMSPHVLHLGDRHEHSYYTCLRNDIKNILGRVPSIKESFNVFGSRQSRHRPRTTALPGMSRQCSAVSSAQYLGHPWHCNSLWACPIRTLPYTVFLSTTE